MRTSCQLCISGKLWKWRLLQHAGRLFVFLLFCLNYLNITTFVLLIRVMVSTLSFDALRARTATFPFMLTSQAIRRVVILCLQFSSLFIVKVFEIRAEAQMIDLDRIKELIMRY